MAVARALKQSAARPATGDTVITGLIGGVVTLGLQLAQTYAPHFHQPAAATVALAVTVLSVAASHLSPRAQSELEAIAPAVAEVAPAVSVDPKGVTSP